MQTKVNNIELKPIWQNLDIVLGADITIGTKNRLKKIIKTCAAHLQAFETSHRELILKYGGVEQPDKSVRLPDPSNMPEGFQVEWQELSMQECTIDFDPVDYHKVEDARTDKTPDFDLIGRFFENYT